MLVDSDGGPHVTDFGLAKRVEGDTELTVSGAVVGTPAYMAPEQTSGRKGSITTATDVYGLGAILFALLTGRPPFGGATVLETLDQVRQRAPARPRTINPLVSYDLEVVCLKCLEKDPGRRYAGADALAQDLNKWLDGKPIVARPVGAATRVWMWSRRKPALAAFLGTAAMALALLGIGGPIVAWREAGLLRIADDRTREARDTHSRATIKGLESLRSLAEGLLREAHELRSRHEEGRDAAAFAAIRRAARTREDSAALLAGLKADDPRLQIEWDAFWNDIVPRLREEAAWWLTEASYQPISEVRVSAPEPPSRSSQRTDLFAISRDGDSVASATTNEARINIIEVTTGDVKLVLEVSGSSGVSHTIRAMGFGESEERLTVVTQAGAAGASAPFPSAPTAFQVSTFDLSSGRRAAAVALQPPAAGFGSLLGKVSISADRRRIVGNAGSERRPIWDADSGKMIGELPGSFEPLGFGPLGHQIVGWYQDQVSYYDPDAARVERQIRLAFDRHENERPPVSISPDGRWIVVWSSQGLARLESLTLLIFDAASSRRVGSVEIAVPNFFNRQSRDGFYPSCFSPDGALLIVQTEENLIGFNLPDGSGAFRVRNPEHTDFKSNEKDRIHWSPRLVGLAKSGSKIVHLVQEVDWTFRPMGTSVVTTGSLTMPPLRSREYRQGSRIADLKFDPAGRYLFGVGSESLPTGWGYGLAEDWPGGAKGSPLGKPEVFFPGSALLATWQGGFTFDRSRSRLDIRDATSGLMRRAPKETGWVFGEEGRFIQIEDDDPRKRSAPKIWDAESSRWAFEFEGLQARSSSAHSGDGRFVATSGLWSDPEVGHGTLIHALPDYRVVRRISCCTRREYERSPHAVVCRFTPSSHSAWVSTRHGGRCGMDRVDLASGRIDQSLGGSDALERIIENPYSSNLKDWAYSPDEGRMAVGFTEKAPPQSGRLTLSKSVAIWKLPSPNPEILPVLREPVLIEASDGPFRNVPMADVGDRPWPVVLAVGGSRLVVAGPLTTDQTPVLELWDLDQRKRLTACLLPGDYSWPISFHVSPDGSRLLVNRAKGGNHAEMWDALDGTVLRKFDGLARTVSPDGRYALLTHQDAECLVDLNSGEIHMKIKDSSPGFSPDGRTLLTHNDGGAGLTLWDLRAGRTRAVLTGQLENSDPNQRGALSWGSISGNYSPGSRWLFTVDSGDAAVNVWEVATGKLRSRIGTRFGADSPSSQLSRISRGWLRPDGKRMVLDVQGQLRLADLEAGRVVTAFGEPKHQGGINAVAVRADGTLVATAGEDGVSLVGEVDAGRFPLMLEGNPGSLRDLAFDPSGDLLACCDSRGRVQLWRIEPGPDASLAPLRARRLWETTEAESHRGTAHAVAFARDGKAVISTGDDGAVRFWNGETGGLQDTFDAHQGPIRALAVSPSKDNFATGGDDGSIHIWDGRTRSPARSWEARQGAIHRLRYSPDGVILAAAGAGVCLWESDRGILLLRLREHVGLVDAIDFSRDGNLLAVGAARGAAMIVDFAKLRRHLDSMNIDWDQ